MASTDETFLPCGSTYRSSHWIGRSTSGLRPCCCARRLVSSRWVSWVRVQCSLWIVFELTNDARTRKIRAGCDLRHDVRDIYTYIYIEKFHSKLVYVGLAQARPINPGPATNTADRRIPTTIYLPLYSKGYFRNFSSKSTQVFFAHIRLKHTPSESSHSKPLRSEFHFYLPLT